MLVHAVLASFCVRLVSASVLCPDGNTCPEKNTCCLTNTGYYGCCVYPFAVCCPDLLHCCPTGYHCEDDTHTCVKQGLPWLRLQWSKNTPVKKETSQTGTALQLSLPKSDNSIAVRESSAILKKPSGVGVGVDVVHCDNYHACPDGYTCCRSVYTWAWGCCPHILGQCCADGIHCCPQGTTCDLLTFRCLSGSDSIPASPQLPALRTDYQEPCCLNGDEAGCCQVGFHCDRERRVCVADLAPLDIWTTLEEQGQGLESPGGGAVALRGVIRCDGRFYCPADHSCCRTPTGEWGCCPYRLGVCCTDGRHCCDYHMSCDESSLSCNQGENSIPSASMGQILRI